MRSLHCGVINISKRNLTEREFQKKLKRIKEENTQKERRMLLATEKRRYSEIPHIETSKLIAIYLFALLNVIVVYSMAAMWRFADLTYLGVLISDIAAQVLIYAIYCIKAYHAKKQSENMKYEREKLNGSLSNILAAGSESTEYVPLTKGTVADAISDNGSVG